MAEVDKAKNTERLLRLFERQNPDGTYYYADQDVRHLLPMVVISLTSEVEISAWPTSIKELLGEFAQAAGLSVDADNTQWQAAIEQYYAAHPIEPGLLRDFQSLVRELLAQGGAHELSEAASKLLGMQPSAPSFAPPPPGAVSLKNLLFQSASGQSKDGDPK